MLLFVVSDSAAVLRFYWKPLHRSIQSTRGNYRSHSALSKAQWANWKTESTTHKKNTLLKKRKSKFQRHFQLSFLTSSEWCFNTAVTDSSTCVRVNFDVALDGYQIFMFEQKIFSSALIGCKLLIEQTFIARPRRPRDLLCKEDTLVVH